MRLGRGQSSTLQRKRSNSSPTQHLAVSLTRCIWSSGLAWYGLTLPGNLYVPSPATIKIFHLQRKVKERQKGQPKSQVRSQRGNTDIFLIELLHRFNKWTLFVIFCFISWGNEYYAAVLWLFVCLSGLPPFNNYWDSWLVPVKEGKRHHSIRF